MTKKELVELLKDVPDDAVMVMPGHSDSDGMVDIYSVNKEEVCQYQDWSGGYHPYYDCDYYREQNYKKVVVFCIT